MHLTTLGWVVVIVVLGPAVLAVVARLLALLFAAVMILLRQDWQK